MREKLKRITTKKTPAYDYLSAELIKDASDKMIQFWTNIIN